MADEAMNWACPEIWTMNSYMTRLWGPEKENPVCVIVTSPLRDCPWQMVCPSSTEATDTLVLELLCFMMTELLLLNTMYASLWELALRSASGMVASSTAFFVFFH